MIDTVMRDIDIAILEIGGYTTCLEMQLHKKIENNMVKLKEYKL